MRKLLAILLVAVSVSAETVILPFVNTSDTGFRTTLVVENLSNKSVSFGPIDVAPQSTTRFEKWLRYGLAVSAFDLPASLRAYVEMIPPNGQTIIQHPMTQLPPGQYRQVLGMRTDGYSSFLVLFGWDFPAQAAVTCKQGSLITKRTTVAVPAHDSVLVECTGVGDLSAEVITGGTVFLLPIRRSLTSGEWVPLPVREILTQ